MKETILQPQLKGTFTLKPQKSRCMLGNGIINSVCMEVKMQTGEPWPPRTAFASEYKMRSPPTCACTSILTLQCLFRWNFGTLHFLRHENHQKSCSIGHNSCTLWKMYPCSPTQLFLFLICLNDRSCDGVRDWWESWPEDGFLCDPMLQVTITSQWGREGTYQITS